MKYTATEKIYGWVWGHTVRSAGLTREKRKALGQQYREILQRAKPIGPHNPLLSSYTLAAFFIALNRVSGQTPEENLRWLREGLKNGRLVRMALGSGKGYFAPRRMEARHRWSERTHQKQYENDWVVDILDKNADYEMGYDYTECGVVKLCRDEGCPELAKYLCSLDFLLVELMGLGLRRTTTLAEGGDKCDFRFYLK